MKSTAGRSNVILGVIVAAAAIGLYPGQARAIRLRIRGGHGMGIRRLQPGAEA